MVCSPHAHYLFAFIEGSRKDFPTHMREPILLKKIPSMGKGEKTQPKAPELLLKDIIDRTKHLPHRLLLGNLSEDSTRTSNLLFWSKKSVM